MKNRPALIVIVVYFILALTCFFTLSQYPASNVKIADTDDAMKIFKAGYYSGAIRQQQVSSVDSTWVEDSVSFRKHIFSIQTKRI